MLRILMLLLGIGLLLDLLRKRVLLLLLEMVGY